jgi:hypothetical protein
MLKGGDRTVGVREGGLEVHQDVGRRALGWRRQLGRRAYAAQRRADRALALVEAFPDALHRPVAEVAMGGADGGGDGAAGSVQEEAPQTRGGHAESSDLVGTPDAEGAAATAARMAVAAEDSPGAQSFTAAVVLVETVQAAMPNEHADHLAMRTARLLEPLGKRIPLRGIAAKPSLLAHVHHAATKTVIIQVRGKGGVRWISRGGVRGENRWPPPPRGQSLCRILGVTSKQRPDSNSATFALKCDQNAVRDTPQSREWAADRVLQGRRL